MAVCVVALAASGGTAWGDATVVVGPDLSTFTTNGIGCNDVNPSAHCLTILGNLTPPSGGLVAVPDDGTLTSWRAKGLAGNGGLVSLLVLRPVGGGSYTISNQSTPTTNVDGTTDNVVNFPVQPGDTLALQLQCGGASFCSSPMIYTQTPPGATYGFWTTFPSPPAATVAGELAVNATETVSGPVVTNVSPSTGGTSGGNTVTITGQHLANATSVTFGSPVANIVSNTNSQVVVTAPQRDPGTVHVQVTTAGGTSAIVPGDQYTYVPERTLTVSVSGPGKVIGNGISCPGDCSQTYLDGTSVSLSAAASSGAKFKSWGGACSGAGACNLSMSADHDVSATFLRAPNTKISQATIDSGKGKATFKFKAVGSATRFQCGLLLKHHGSKPRIKACHSPQTYRNLRPGKYLFAVRAFGPGGPDPTPAKKKFTIR